MHGMYSIKIVCTSVCCLYDWLRQFKCLSVSGPWSDGGGSGISDSVWSVASILACVADTMFGVNGRKEYVGLAVRIRLEVWNRVLCSVNWHSG